MDKLLARVGKWLSQNPDVVFRRSKKDNELDGPGKAVGVAA